MKARTLHAGLLFLLPVLLHAQKVDFDALHSAQQLRYGVQAFHRGFFNDALTSLEKAVSYQPSNTVAQLWLGRAQWKSGYEQEAQRTWQQVVDSGRGSALVRDWIATLGLRRGLGRELRGSPTFVVSSELDVVAVADELSARGWPTARFLEPPALHFLMDRVDDEAVIHELLRELAAVADDIRSGRAKPVPGGIGYESGRRSL